jgi:hypothetical protein
MVSRLPCLRDVPLRSGNLHFGGVQERKGSVDTCTINNYEHNIMPSSIPTCRKSKVLADSHYVFDVLRTLPILEVLEISDKCLILKVPILR